MAQQYACFFSSGFGMADQAGNPARGRRAARPQQAADSGSSSDGMTIAQLQRQRQRDEVTRHQTGIYACSYTGARFVGCAVTTTYSAPREGAEASPNSPHNISPSLHQGSPGQEDGTYESQDEGSYTNDPLLEARMLGDDGVRPTDFPWPIERTLTETGLTCEGQPVNVKIYCRMEKGFSMLGRVWTCYRRNYFEISGAYSLDPPCQGKEIYLRGRRVQSFGMVPAASVCDEGTDFDIQRPVNVINHTPKRDAKNRKLVRVKKIWPGRPLNTLGPHPRHYAGFGGSLVPVLPYQETVDPDPEALPPTTARFATGNESVPLVDTGNDGLLKQYSFERLQFATATANNGKRRAVQQYFRLKLQLFCDIREDGEQMGAWVKLAEKISDPVVVRGRSPNHYKDEDRDELGPDGGNGGNGGGGAAGSGGSSGMHVGPAYANAYGYGHAGPSTAPDPSRGGNFGGFRSYNAEPEAPVEEDSGEMSETDHPTPSDAGYARHLVNIAPAPAPAAGGTPEMLTDDGLLLLTDDTLCTGQETSLPDLAALVRAAPPAPLGPQPSQDQTFQQLMARLLAPNIDTGGVIRQIQPHQVLRSQPAPLLSSQPAPTLPSQPAPSLHSQPELSRTLRSQAEHRGGMFREMIETPAGPILQHRDDSISTWAHPDTVNRLYRPVSADGTASPMSAGVSHRSFATTEASGLGYLDTAYEMQCSPMDMSTHSPMSGQALSVAGAAQSFRSHSTPFSPMVVATPDMQRPLTMESQVALFQSPTYTAPYMAGYPPPAEGAPIADQNPLMIAQSSTAVYQPVMGADLHRAAMGVPNDPFMGQGMPAQMDMLQHVGPQEPARVSSPFTAPFTDDELLAHLQAQSAPHGVYSPDYAHHIDMNEWVEHDQAASHADPDLDDEHGSPSQEQAASLPPDRSMPEYLLSPGAVPRLRFAVGTGLARLKTSPLLAPQPPQEGENIPDMLLPPILPTMAQAGPNTSTTVPGDESEDDYDDNSDAETESETEDTSGNDANPQPRRRRRQGRWCPFTAAWEAVDDDYVQPSKRQRLESFSSTPSHSDSLNQTTSH